MPLPHLPSGVWIQRPGDRDLRVENELRSGLPIDDLEGEGAHVKQDTILEAQARPGRMEAVDGEMGPGTAEVSEDDDGSFIRGDHARSLRSVCAFCDIVRGDKPAEVVFEDDFCVAFLDIRPLFPGHCLVIPREHYETLADLPASGLEPFFSVVRLLSRAVPSAVEAEGTFVAVNNKVSQSVPHLHAHVVPRRQKDGLKGFFWPRNGYRDAAQMQETAEAIRAAAAAVAS